jgi:hypothetical protein
LANPLDNIISPREFVTTIPIAASLKMAPNWKLKDVLDSKRHKIKWINNQKIKR